jgi:hypothetical protein
LASKGKKTELTDNEKAELALKVYPKLKKNSRVLRFLRFGNAVLMLLMLCSCAAAVSEPEMTAKSTFIGSMIKKGMVQDEDPAEFEKAMPESDIMLSSLVSYTKQPTVKHISDDVIDADYEAGLLVLLKKDRLETNLLDCPSVLLKDDRYISAAVAGRKALVTGAKSAVLIDLENCGILSETDSRGKGFSISDGYLIEFSKNTFELYNSAKTKKIHGGNFLGAVVAGQLSGSAIMFANENGKVALMDAETGTYTAIHPDRMEIKELYFEKDYVYVYDTSNKLIKLTADYGRGTLEQTGSAQAKEGCFFLKRSGYLYCDGYILGTESAYKSPVEADSGIVRDGLIFLIKNGELNFVDTELKYRKNVQFAPSGKRLCLSGGRAYFRDLDEKVLYITAKGDEMTAENMPAECDHRFDFDKGELKTPDGTVIYKFASEVIRNEKAVMYKRIIGDGIYYFFEKLSSD